MNESRKQPPKPVSPATTAAAEPGPAKEPLDPETTLDLLRALEGAAIVIEQPAAAPPQPEPEPSFNPYDRGPAKPNRKRQPP